MLRYIKIASFYKQAIDAYYRTFPDMETENYETQYRHFMDQCYSWGDVYERELTDIGIDAFLLPTNVDPLIRQWALENNIEGTLQDIVLLQLKEFTPDIIYIDDTSFFAPYRIGDLRKEIPRLKLIIGGCCSPYNTYTLQVYRQCDFVICCCKQLSEELRKMDIRTYVVMHGFDSSILSKINDNPNRDIDVLFTGSIMSGRGFHRGRSELINAILRSGINIHVYGNITADKFLTTTLKQIAYFFLLCIKKINTFGLPESISRRIGGKAFPQYLRIPYLIRKNAKPPVFGLEMLGLLKRSKICLNAHGDIAVDGAANMRLFEATGMGCCLVTDWKIDMCKLFDDGAEVITYQDAEDCINKLKWLLDHPDRIRDIAEAGQRRCLRDYTILERSREIYEILKKELIQRFPEAGF